ncbi:MAG TPA: hypothetical protein VNZ57_14645 [Longimicrobiales bacterium]|nr:hypothetical protein [Longimicrobiales bacterium]
MTDVGAAQAVPDGSPAGVEAAPAVTPDAAAAPAPSPAPDASPAEGGAQSATQPDTATQPASPTGTRVYRNAREFREAMRNRLSEQLGTGEQAAEKPPQPRDELGRFQSPAAAEASADSPAPQPGAQVDEATEATPATEQVPEGFVRLEVPEGHPLRDRGVTSIVAPEAEADYHRYQLNNPVRARAVEEARLAQREAEQRAQQLEQELLRTQAQLETYLSVFTNADVTDQLQRIRDEYGEEGALRYLRGLLVEQQERIDRAVDERVQERLAVEVQQQAQGIVRSLIAERPQRYPHWSDEELRRVVAAWGSYMDQAGVQHFDRQAFYEFADGLYRRNPSAQADLQQRVQQQIAALREKAEKAAEERARRETEERIRREQEEAAALRRRFNPLAHIPAGAATPGTAVGAQASRPMSTREWRQALRRLPA